MRLARANLVFVRYCTSDAWAGEAAAAPPTGFAFRGRDVLAAVVGDLVHRGLGRFPGTRVLLGGCGTGALGALLNADRVSELLQTLIVPSSNLRRFGALLDSPLAVEELPMPGVASQSLMAQAQGVLALTGASAGSSAACRAAHPQPADAWRCLFASYALPFVRSDLFLHAFQYDSAQLAADTGAGVPNRTPEQRAYAEAFRNATRAIAFGDVIKPAASGSAAMLPACFAHCNTLGDGFGSLATDGFTLEQAVSSWFYGQGHSENDDEHPAAAAAAAVPGVSNATEAVAALRSLRGSSSKPGGGGGGGGDASGGRKPGGGGGSGSGKPPPPPSVPQFVVDNCAGFNCGDHCSNGPPRSGADNLTG